MTISELNKFRNAIRNLRAELVYAAGGRTGAPRLLLEVRSALSRINARTFGICLSCRREIDLNQLMMTPWMSSCIVCQKASDGIVRPAGRVVEESLAGPA